MGFIREYFGQHGYPPTISEIGQAVGLRSKSSVWFNLRALEDAGHIQLGPMHKTRTMQILDGLLRPSELPVAFLGRGRAFVVGSSSEPKAAHLVVLLDDGRASCSCPAGRFASPCKHAKAAQSLTR
jgi:SOS-response transcriptional repressor LexA